MRNRTLVITALCISLAACGGGKTFGKAHPTTTNPNHTIVGSLVLTDTNGYFSPGGVCTGSDGYDDIQEGADVFVKDGAGSIIATSSLIAGHSTDESTCTFGFAVPNVPNATFYQIEVSHRGALHFSHADLESKSWVVGFTLGS